MKESAFMVSAAVGGGTVSGSAVITWLFECWIAGGIIKPDSITATAMAGFIFPVLYAMRNAFISQIEVPDPADVVVSAPATELPKS
jgi:hypothetical protein